MSPGRVKEPAAGRAAAGWQELLAQTGTEVGTLVRVSGPLTTLDSLTVAQADEDAAWLRDQQWERCVATGRRVDGAMVPVDGGAWSSQMCHTQVSRG